jgi:hypothetical protein
MGISKYISGDRSPKALNTTNSERLVGGVAGALPYQNAVGSTLFTAAGSAGQLLQSNGITSPSWASFSSLSATPAYVIMNSGGQAFTSTDSVTWTSRPASLACQGMAYGGGVLVGVRLFSTSTTRSTDGITWTLLGPGITFGGFIMHGNGLFVATTGSQGTAYTSTDGISWTSRTVPTTTYLGGAYGNGNFVMTGGSGGSPSTVATYSTNGITWTAATMPSSQVWRSVAFGNGRFVSMAEGATAAAWSTNGVTWTASTPPTNTQWQSIAFGNGVFVAISSGGAFGRSTDGVTWTTGTVGTGQFNRTTYGYGRFVTAGSQGFATSTDGTTWSYTGTFAFSTVSDVVSIPAVSVNKDLVRDIAAPISSTAYTVSPGESWLNLNSLAACVLTLPSAALFKYKVITVRQTAAFAVTSASANVAPLTSQTPGTAILSGSGKYAKLVSDGVNWIIMEAN